VKEALAEMRQNCEILTVLGSYEGLISTEHLID
jgi:hypothetical protein